MKKPFDAKKFKNTFAPFTDVDNRPWYVGEKSMRSQHSFEELWTPLVQKYPFLAECYVDSDGVVREDSNDAPVSHMDWNCGQMIAGIIVVKYPSDDYSVVQFYDVETKYAYSIKEITKIFKAPAPPVRYRAEISSTLAKRIIANLKVKRNSKKEVVYNAEGRPVLFTTEKYVGDDGKRHEKSVEVSYSDATEKLYKDGISLEQFFEISGVNNAPAQEISTVNSTADNTAEIGAQIQPATDSVNADSAQPVSSDATAESEIQPATSNSRKFRVAWGVEEANSKCRRRKFGLLGDMGDGSIGVVYTKSFDDIICSLMTEVSYDKSHGTEEHLKKIAISVDFGLAILEKSSQQKYISAHSWLLDNFQYFSWFRGKDVNTPYVAKKCYNEQYRSYYIDAEPVTESVNADNDAQISGAQIVNSNEEANQMSNENSTTQIAATTVNTPEIQPAEIGDKIIDADKILAAAKALEAALNGNSSDKQAVIHAIQSKVASALGVDKTKAAVKIALNLPAGRESSDTDILNALKKLAGQSTTAAPVAPKTDKPATPKADKPATDKTPAPVVTPPQIINTDEIEAIKKQIADGESYISMYRKMAENNSDTMRAEITKHISKHEAALNQLRNKLTELAAPAPILWMNDCKPTDEQLGIIREGNDKFTVGIKSYPYREIRNVRMDLEFAYQMKNTIEGQILSCIKEIRAGSLKIEEIITHHNRLQIGVILAAAKVELFPKIVDQNPAIKNHLLQYGYMLDDAIEAYQSACRQLGEKTVRYAGKFDEISSTVAKLADLVKKYPQVVNGSKAIQPDKLNAALNYKVPELVGIEVDDTDNQPAPEIDAVFDMTDIQEYSPVNFYANPSDGVNVPFYTPSNFPIYTPSNFPFSFDNVIPATDDFYFSLNIFIPTDELLAAVITEILSATEGDINRLFGACNHFTDDAYNISRITAGLEAFDKQATKLLELKNAGLNYFTDLSCGYSSITRTDGPVDAIHGINTVAKSISHGLQKIDTIKAATAERITDCERVIEYLGKCAAEINDLLAFCPAVRAEVAGLIDAFDAAFDSIVRKFSAAIEIINNTKSPFDNLPDAEPSDDNPAPNAPTSPIAPPDASIDTNPSTVEITPANAAPTQSITPEIITAEPNPNAATNFDIQKFAAPDSAAYEVSGFAYGSNDNTNLALFETLLIELHEEFGDDTGDGVGLSYQSSENRQQNKIRFDVDADIVLSFNGIIPYEDYVRLCNCTPGVKVQMDANRTEIQPVAPIETQPENDNARPLFNGNSYCL